MGLLYKLSVKLINFLIFFFMVVYLPGLPPKTTFPFEPFEITSPRELKGALEVNNLLDNAERLFEDKLYGPEAFLVRGNDLYTTIHGGEVVKINGKHITHVAKFGKPCEFAFEEEICGRPLGMAFDTQGNNIIVADSYFGIWSVDLSNGEKKLIIAPDTILEGKEVHRKAKIFNSVAVAKNGDIYWTDSSSDFSIQDGIYTMLANPSGRLFHYNRETKINKVLIDNIFFANGLVLSPNEDFVLVSETGKGTIRRYYIAGPKKGTEDVFISGLPGNTDNLIADAEGVWAPLVLAIDSENPSLISSMTKVPLVRKFLLRLFALLEMPFKMINNAMPNMYTKKVIHALGHFELLTPIRPPRSTVVRLDWNGQIIGSLHGFDRSVEGISHVAELGDYLYLGSPFNKYLARIKMPRPPKIRVREVPEAEVKPKPTTTTTTTPKPTTTTTTPKPTTTTPKPTTTTTTPKPAPTTTTTTPKPTTTTTTPKPAPTTTTTTPKPTTQAPTEAPKVVETPKPTPAAPKVVVEEPKKEAPKVEPVVPAAKPVVEEKKAEAPKPKTTPPVKPVKSTTKQPETPKDPAPIVEKIPNDVPNPEAIPEKLKVINKEGQPEEIPVQ